MALEIEHKFLLINNEWRTEVSHSIEYRQGYLSSQPTSSIRIRTSADKAWINIKSAVIGTQRLEYEYSIPLNDAIEILNTLCRKPLIEKIRHFIPTSEGYLWEIDEFLGDNAGLIVAEIELPQADTEFFKPHWLGQEVTNDMRYYNNNLAISPFNTW